MATIHLVLSAEDHQHFSQQVEREGKTLDAWLISVARQCLAQPGSNGKGSRFESEEDLWEFLREHSGWDGPERELDWEEHLRNMDASIRDGLPDV